MRGNKKSREELMRQTGRGGGEETGRGKEQTTETDGRSRGNESSLPLLKSTEAS